MRIKNGLIILFTALLLLIFSGCNAGVISNAPTETETAIETTQAVTTETVSTSAPVTTAQSTTAAVTTSEVSTETTTKKTTKEKTTVTEKKTEKTTDKKKLKCTVTIECSEIYKHLDDLKSGHEKYLPKNGIFVNKYECTIKDGYTVYDVIRKAGKTKDLKFTVKDTQFGLYIAGINNLDEFDVGGSSGWVYYINGEFGRTSVSNCEVKDGDEIVLKYTCGQ